MSDDNRILGQLLEHARHTRSRLDNIEKKIDGLQAFKWKIIGGTALISFLLSIMVEVFFYLR